MVVLGFLLPLGAETQPAFLANGTLKLAALAAAVLLLVGTVVGNAAGMYLTHAVRRTALPLGLYAAALTALTLTRDLPSIRYQGLVVFLVAAVGFVVCEATRVGSFVDITYRVGVAHLILAVGSGQSQTLKSGVERYAGATSAVLIGLESALVLILALTRWRARAGSAPQICLVVAALSAYTLYASFSRAALISATLGLVALVAFRVRRHRVLKVSAASAAVWALYAAFSEQILWFLGGADPDSVTGASGRYSIWDRVITANTEWWRGWGFAALKYSDGPDWGLFVLTQGLPAENALLQAALMGGFVGAAVWLWLLWRSARALWEARDVSRGATVYLGIVIGVAAVFSAGMSGSSSDYWWLLAAVSLAARPHPDAGTSSGGAVLERSRAAAS